MTRLRRYRIATPGLDLTAEAGSPQEAVHARVAELGLTQLLGVQRVTRAGRDVGQPTFFRRRGETLYPISARVAALELSMGGPQ